VNPPAAIAHISQVHGQLVDPQVRAQAAAMLGRMLLFTGQPQEAATVVQRALADLPAERAGTRRPASLTPSERRVADMAAAGKSNRDIARALYVTPKTVEVHLTSVYRKPGIRRRSGLSSAL
jgi:DNA-binding CsgD family transcriptional regulator